MTTLTLDRPRPDGIPPAGPVESSTARIPAVPPAPDWSHAACAAYPDLPWVPDGPGAEDAVLPALAPICAGCPVAAACRAWATDIHAVGIWGGTTTEQRRPPRPAPVVVSSVRLCSVDGCTRPAPSGRGLMCSTHRWRKQRGKPMEPPIGPAGPYGVCDVCARIVDLIGCGTPLEDIRVRLGYAPGSVSMHLRRHGDRRTANRVAFAENGRLRADQVVSIVRGASWRAEQARRGVS